MVLSTFTFSSTAEEIATAFSQEIAGKNVLITGTSIGGIGFEAARVMARFANLVIITGYNDERLKLSEDAIMEETPSANIRRLKLNLASLAAVRAAAAEVNAYPAELHVLINNAAGGSGGQLSVDGFDSLMATDHFGPFLFTQLLIPKLLAARTDTYIPRVVFVSSVVHTQGAGVDLAALRANPRTIIGETGYHQAKCANIMTAIELSPRTRGRIHGYSLHPGVIFTNALKKEQLAAFLKTRDVLTPDGQPNLQNPNVKWKTIPQGAATTIASAFDPQLNDTPGAYLVDSNVANDTVAAHCSNLDNCRKLWDITEEIVGERFLL